jgi:hypothetical protein
MNEASINSHFTVSLFLLFAGRLVRDHIFSVCALQSFKLLRGRKSTFTPDCMLERS